jgi:DNA-directed RNA polymerase specialized sigma24 family protein
MWVYSQRVLTSWVSTGKIFRKVAALGRPVTRSPRLDGDVDLVRDLVDDAIMGGLGLFKREVLSGRWYAGGGASLRSYFVGACILEFPNAYRRGRALTEQTATPTEPALIYDELDRGTRAGPGILTLISEYEQLERYLADHGPLLRQILHYIAEGYTAKETARLLGTTDRAVESRLGRLRAQLSARPTPSTMPTPPSAPISIATGGAEPGTVGQHRSRPRRVPHRGSTSTVDRSIEEATRTVAMAARIPAHRR